ncbi:MAG: DUF5667 domain-containing protein, partial [Actinomycetota bacterium]
LRFATDRCVADEAVVAAGRRVFTLPRVAAACLITLALLVGLGFASSYAMPGNPLYSVKRVLESARLFLTSGGEGDADARLDMAETRLDELEYTEERGMDSWYIALAGDASRYVRLSLEESDLLPQAEAERIRSRALDLLRRLDSTIKRLFKGAPDEQADTLQREIDDTMDEYGGNQDGPPAEKEGRESPGEAPDLPERPPDQQPPAETPAPEDPPADHLPSQENRRPQKEAGQVLSLESTGMI